MNAEYVRELDGSYLLLPACREKENFAERMLLLAHPPGLLPFKLYQEEPERKYSYEISGRKSLAALCAEEALEAEQIRGLLRSLYRCCEEMEQYLLKPDELCLGPGFMYLGKEGWAFCCLPDHEESLALQLQVLSRYFLRKCNHDDPETAYLAYELFHLCHEDNTTFPQILELIGQEEGTKEEQEKEKAPSRSSFWHLFRRKG